MQESKPVLSQYMLNISRRYIDLNWSNNIDQVVLVVAIYSIKSNVSVIHVNPPVNIPEGQERRELGSGHNTDLIQTCIFHISNMFGANSLIATLHL